MIFSVFSSYFPLHYIRFPRINLSSATKTFNFYFLAGINTKYFWNIPEGESFAPLRILNLFIKSFVYPFVALTFSDSSFIKFLSNNMFMIIMISSNFIFNFIKLCVIVNFLTKFLTLGILVSTVVRAVVVVAILVTLGILFLTSFV